MYRYIQHAGSAFAVMTYTYSVRDDLHDTGGSLTLDYEVMLAGSVCERCRNHIHSVRGGRAGTGELI